MAALLTLLLAVAPATPPPTALLVTRRTNASQTEALAAARDAVVLLEAAGVPISLAPDGAAKKLARLGVTDTSACNGKKGCVAELGRQLLVEHVIALSVSRIDQDRSLAFELVQVSTQGVTARDTVLLAGQAPLTAEAVTPFADLVKKALGLEAPKPPPPPVDVPKKDPEVVVTPKVDPQPPPVLPPPPPPPPPEKSHVAQWAMAGAGVAAVVAGAVLLSLGSRDRAALAAGTPVGDQVHSSLTGSEAQKLAGRSSLEVGAGASALALGAGLGLAAALTW